MLGGVQRRADAAVSRALSPVGRLLRHWRQARGMSQLALALRAGVTQRHVSFVESGRSRPGRQMVLTLAGVLDVPLRERNQLLLAAGYAPVYPEDGLVGPDSAQVRAALERMLAGHEPYPAVVMDRHWNVLLTNKAAGAFFGWLRANERGSEGGADNVIRMMFDPAGLRPFVTNWEAVARSLVSRVHREAVGGVPDAETAALLREVLAFPGVPASWQFDDLDRTLLPIVPVRFEKAGIALSYFSTITTFGTPQDVALQELRVESFYPADEETSSHAW
jgi:transcriptional regulator with XRE-family HTH domain